MYWILIYLLIEFAVFVGISVLLSPWIAFGILLLGPVVVLKLISIFRKIYEKQNTIRFVDKDGNVVETADEMFLAINNAASSGYSFLDYRVDYQTAFNIVAYKSRVAMVLGANSIFAILPGIVTTLIALIATIGHMPTNKAKRMLNKAIAQQSQGFNQVHKGDVVSHSGEETVYSFEVPAPVWFWNFLKLFMGISVFSKYSNMSEAFKKDAFSQQQKSDKGPYATSKDNPYGQQNTQNAQFAKEKQESVVGDAEIVEEEDNKR